MRRLAYRRRMRSLWQAWHSGERDDGALGDRADELRKGLETASSCAAFLDLVALPIGPASGFIPLEDALCVIDPGTTA